MSEKFTCSFAEGCARERMWDRVRELGVVEETPEGSERLIKGYSYGLGGVCGQDIRPAETFESCASRVWGPKERPNTPTYTLNEPNITGY